jgi:hypothetical protein
VAGSVAERVGDPAAGAAEAASVTASEIWKGEARTPVRAGAEAPFGELSPAPGPPQPAVPLAVAGVGNWNGLEGARGAPPDAGPDESVTSAPVVTAGTAGLAGVVAG